MRGLNDMLFLEELSQFHPYFASNNSLYMSSKEFENSRGFQIFLAPTLEFCVLKYTLIWTENLRIWHTHRPH
jgi:hypothetical protein